MSEKFAPNQEPKNMTLTIEMLRKMTHDERVDYAWKQVQKKIDSGLIPESDRQREFDSYLLTRESRRNVMKRFAKQLV